MSKKVIEKMAKSLSATPQSTVDNYLTWLSVLRGKSVSKQLFKALKKISTVS